MQVVVIFASVIAVACAVNPAAIYRSRCSEGASYWCDTAMHADECGAIEYCIQNHWRGKLVQESAICSDCETFINGVHNVLDQTSVQALILSGAKEACTVMGTLSTVCETVVETLGPEVLQKLVTELTADEVCNVLGFCKQEMMKQGSPAVCAVCKMGMTEIQQVLSDVSVQQSIENEILSLCPMLESVLPNCKQMVQEYFPTVMQLILQYANAQTCTDFGICPGSIQLQKLYEKVKQLTAHEAGIDMCSTCKTVTGEIDQYLDNAAVQEAVRLELDQLCYTLGTELAPICVYAVNTYTKQIFAGIVNIMNPDTFCVQIRLCPSTMEPQPRIQTLQLTSLSGNKQCTQCAALSTLLSNETVQVMWEKRMSAICNRFGTLSASCKMGFRAIRTMAQSPNMCSKFQFCTPALQVQPQVTGDPCSDCEAFFQDISGMLTNQTVQNLLISKLDSVCEQLGSFSAQCKSYVDSYGTLAFTFLASAINPQQVCQSVGFCSAKPVTVKLGADQCTDCKAFVGDISAMLQNKTVQNLILQNLDSVCSQLGSFADQCKALVDQYGALAFDFLASEIDPDMVCSSIGFCPSSLVSKVKKPTGPSKQCTDCEAFAGDVLTALSDPNLQYEIVNALEGACGLFGSSADMCRSYLEQYGETVLQFILSSVDADTVCNDIGFCMSGSAGGLAFRLRARAADSSKYCDVCEDLFSDTIAFLMNPIIEKDIISALEGVCGLLGPYAAQCRTYLEQNGLTDLETVIVFLDANPVCQDIGLCLASSAREDSLRNLKVGYPSSVIDKVRVATEVTGPSKVCTDCENFMQDILKKLTDPTVQTWLISAVESLCSVLGASQDTCEENVAQYGYMVLEFLAESLDPDSICNDIGFCMSAVSKPKKAAKPESGEVCTMCQAIVAAFESYLASETNQAVFLQYLDKACAYLGPFSAQCKTLAKTYTPELINAFIAYFDPLALCTDISMCTGTGVMKRVKADPTLCTDCKAFMADVDAMLSNQTFQQQTLAQLEGLCSMAGSLQAECKLLVQTYGPAAFQFLVTYLNPETVCAQIGFCSADSTPVAKALLLTAPVIQPMTVLQAAKPHPLSNKPLPLTDGPGCEFCQTVVGLFLPQLESNKTEEEILDAVAEICDLFPTEYAQECNNYVHDYGYLIIEMLKQELSPKEICADLGLCASKAISRQHQVIFKNLKNVMSQLPTSNEFCAVCELAVQEVDTILSSNKSKEEIKADFVKYVCGNLPSPVDQQCDSFMMIYGDVLIQLLIEQLDSKTFCTDVGLCDASIETQLPPKYKVPQPEATTQCIVCEYVVKELDSLLEENATEAEIRDALDKVCAELPLTLSSECKQLVDTYSEDIIKYLVNEFDPAALCTAIGVCSSAETRAVMKAKAAEIKKVAITPDCMMCEYIMSELDSILADNATKDEIEAALDKVCVEFPITIKAECEKFVSTYTPILISYLTQQLPPSEFCAKMGFCAGDKVQQLEASPECAICELVVSELDSVLSENSTEEEIKKALEEVCDKLPSTLKSDCQTFVTVYEPLLIKYLLTEKPEEICTLFKLCEGSFKSYLDSLECDACQIAVRGFMDALQEPSVTKEIVLLVNETCAILPTDLKTQCYSYVDQYGDLVTEFIAQFFDPITSCTLLGECPSPSNDPLPPAKHLLGAHECTRGPGFWCASMDNAKQCNMVEHCRRHVWN